MRPRPTTIIPRRITGHTPTIDCVRTNDRNSVSPSRAVNQRDSFGGWAGNGLLLRRERSDVAEHCRSDPSGSITLNETFATGYGGGSGTLSFNGSNYPFTLVGAVVGPGGAERVAASGEVYKLANVQDFAGPLYTVQRSGGFVARRRGRGLAGKQRGCDHAPPKPDPRRLALARKGGDRHSPEPLAGNLLRAKLLHDFVAPRSAATAV
jgi:hypothetical protein